MTLCPDTGSSRRGTRHSDTMFGFVTGYRGPGARTPSGTIQNVYRLSAPAIHVPQICIDFRGFYTYHATKDVFGRYEH